MTVQFDFNALYWFVKVVEAGSMTKAAKLGGVAISTVSDRIRQAEQSVKVRLLERTTRRLRLTEAGELYFARAQAAVAAAEAARSAAEAWHQIPSGLITVSAPPEMPRTQLRAAVMAMVQRYPKIVLRFIFTTERSDLLREHIDVALRIGELGDSQLIAKKLTTMKLHLVATPQFVARGPRIQHPRDLQRRNCVPVVSLSNNKVWPWVFRKGTETVTVMPTGSIEVSSVGAGLDFALAGHGIALISDALYRQVPAGTLRVLLPKWHLPNAPVWAVYPSKSHLSPKVRLFVEHLSTALRPAEPR
jgi:DNA-binding transcriptional LysR family regulator